MNDISRDHPAQPGAGELLQSLGQRGVKIWAEAGKLRFQARKGVLLPEDMRHLQALKSQIVALLDQLPLPADAPLERRPTGHTVPLTALQLSWWKHRLKGQRWGARRCVTARRILGSLDESLLRACIDIVVSRHESLRTHIAFIEEVPSQEIQEWCDYTIGKVDLSGWPDQDRDAEIIRLAHEFAEQPIDISVGPLFGMQLLKLSEREHVLVSGFDHLVSDRISKDMIDQEVWTLYSRGARGLKLSLPPLGVQFPDYAVWQRRTFDSWKEKHEAYWREKLQGAESTSLPADHTLSSGGVSTRMMEELRLSATLTSALRDLARRERTFLGLVMLTVYSIVVSEWCKRRDLVLMFIADGRGTPEMKAMTGFIASMLVLRVPISAEDRFIDVLHRVGREFDATHEHHDFDRLPHFMPVPSTDLSFNWLPAEPPRPQTLTAEHSGDPVTVQPFPFKVSRVGKFEPLFFETATEILVELHYRSDFWSRDTVTRFGQDLQAVADSLAKDPYARITWACL